MKARWIFALVLLLAWIGGIGARLYQLQVQDHQEYQDLAKRQQLRRITLESPRGTIYDSRGRKLALSLEVDSAWACPREVDDPAAAATQLAGVLGLDRQKLEEKLSKEKEFVWVARQLDSPVSAAVRELDLAGVTFLKESKRYYPMRELASQVVGFASVDHKGLEGLEGLYDQVVTGEPVNRRVLRDAHFGTASSPTLSFGDAEPGRDLYLTIDIAIQHIVERELARAVEQSQARGGTALVLDPHSGAVLAMASLPSFDPNRFRHFDASQRRNRVVADAFEPGSTFKMVTAAAALEANLIDPTDILDCERGGITLHGIRINDHHSFDLLTFREVIAKSSNIGAIKTGLMVGQDLFYQQIQSFGFGAPTGIDLPGEASGLVRPAERWARMATAYISFGQGISVTAIQLASAFAAVANGGQLLQPYVVHGVGRGDDIELVHPRPTLRGMPVTPGTARTLERLLEAVVTEGTGKKAAIEGYRVAGKTGTAQKVDGGRGYSPTKFVASFVGFAPAREPAVVTLIVIDEPKGAYHGGDVAAPVFSAIVREVLLYLRVPPQREPPARWPGELLADIDEQDPESPATAALDLDGVVEEAREGRSGARLRSRAMRLTEVIEDLPITCSSSENPAVSGITHDSRRVGAGDLFAALVGQRYDGRMFVPEAMERGAVGVLASDIPAPDFDQPWLVTENPRSVLGPLAARIHRHPDRELITIGVTGTNGKTTVSLLLAAFLEEAGFPTGSLGTLGYSFGDRIFGGDRTTPEATDFFHLLRQMHDEGATAVCAEISSHALAQDRVEGGSFDLAVFTNLTRDHFDYHRDFESYFESKRRLFGQLKPEGRTVVNIDDPYGRRLADEIPGAITFGEAGDVRVSEAELDLQGIRCRLLTPRGELDLVSPLLGDYNLSNLLAAVAGAEALELPHAAVKDGAAGRLALPGRMEVVDCGQVFPVVIDYAHTDAALEAALRSLKSFTGRKVILVFGCGGDRDPGKRALMGRVAGDLAELSIITSDNPRSEDPLAIIAEVEKGLQQSDDPSYRILPDRREAIRRAVAQAGPDWAVLIAGKGHEEVQIIGDEQLPFSDREEVERALEEHVGAGKSG